LKFKIVVREGENKFTVCKDRRGWLMEEIVGAALYKEVITE
jgi:hypothetical protein